MSGWIFLIAYLAGWVVGYRLAYQFFANDEVLADASDSFDRVMASVMSALVALFWPVGIPLALLHRFVRPVTTREREAKLQQRQDELDQRERDIRSLERELGVGPAAPGEPTVDVRDFLSRHPDALDKLREGRS
jgi:hypothetical protein